MNKKILSHKAISKFHSQVSILKRIPETVEDDTLEEAPSISEDIVKETKKSRESNIIGTTKSKHIESSHNKKQAKVTHFKALVLMGENLFSEIEKGKSKRSREQTTEKKNDSHTLVDRERNIVAAKEKISQDKNFNLDTSNQDKIKSLKIKEENEIRTDIILKPVSKINTIDEEMCLNFDESKNQRTQNKVSGDTSNANLSTDQMDEVASKTQSSFQSSKNGNKNKTTSIKASTSFEEKDVSFGNDPAIDDVATALQAGYKGMITREKMKTEEDKEEKKIVEKSQDIENKLGTDLDHPKIAESATTIQASFRGATVPDNSDKEYSEYESESSYYYEDEDEESESYQERPKSPKTAVESFSQTVPSIAGFKATAIIGSWIQRRKQQPRALTTSEENDIATKIQAGYRGMRTREDARPKPSIAGLRVSTHIVNWSQKTKKIIRRPLSDLEIDDAATRIQAGFRGMKAREEMRTAYNNRSNLPESSKDHATSKNHEAVSNDAK